MNATWNSESLFAAFAACELDEGTSVEMDTDDVAHSAGSEDEVETTDALAPSRIVMLNAATNRTQPARRRRQVRLDGALRPLCEVDDGIRLRPIVPGYRCDEILRQDAALGAYQSTGTPLFLAA